MRYTFWYTMETTTVKLQKRTKFLLDRLKKKHESYDKVILRIASSNKKNELRKKLIENYKKAYNADRELVKEWEVASSEVPDE